MVIDSKQAFSDRMNIALDMSGFPAKGKGRQGSVAKMFGVSQQAARKWLEGESIPDTKRISEIAKKLKVSGEWLITGGGSPKDQISTFAIKLAEDLAKDPNYIKHNLENILRGSKTGPDIKDLVPVITWKQAASWEKIKYNLSSDDVIQWRPTTAELGSFPFSLQLKDDSMSPDFPEDCFIIFDPQGDAKPGNYVLALKDKAEEPVFAQLLSSGDEKYLRATNPRYPIKIFDETWEIIAIAKKGEIDI